MMGPARRWIHLLLVPYRDLCGRSRGTLDLQYAYSAPIGPPRQLVSANVGPPPTGLYISYWPAGGIEFVSATEVRIGERTHRIMDNAWTAFGYRERRW